MPVTYLSLVNQKFAYARALLALIPDETMMEGARERLLRRALLDAAVAHMVCAYQHYLRELAEGYRLKQLAEIHSEQDLLTALAVLGRTSAEVDELLQLRSDGTTWLAKLFLAYQDQSALPRATAQMASETAENLIAAVEVYDEPAELEVTPERVARWQSAFSDLIHRQRETSAEY